MRSKEYYLRLRNKYTPDNIRVIFLLESPPNNGNYFYDSNGGVDENLFSAMMNYLEYSPITKEDGLAEFKKRGYLIIDSIYEPVNNLRRGVSRNKKIAIKTSELVNDIVNKQRSGLKIIIIMAHLHKMFYGLLGAIGFNIINDKPIPFPLYQWKQIFLTELQKLKIKFHLL